ncbi:hypothetical protein LUZ60_004917 [Juncus effusus]|nr:hypothetical protein LUZ60_004917 [Juncus effusus]
MDDDESAVSVDLPPPTSATSAGKTSLLDTVGAEVIRIVSPVSLCMLLVVLLVSSLSSSSDPLRSASSIILSNSNLSGSNLSDSNSTWDEIKSALITSFSFVVMVTLMTFVLVLLFYFRCINFLKIYMGISSLFVLSFLGGFISILLISQFKIPIDPLTFFLLLINLSISGVLSIFLPKFPISLNQGFLVTIGVLTAYWFTFLPEWTTWVLLVAMSLYDLAAVLLPIGPLRLLVELAISRNEDIPALVYEARPVNPVPDSGTRIWRRRRRNNLGTDSTDSTSTDEITAPLIGTETVSDTRLNLVSDTVSSDTMLNLVSDTVSSDTRINLVSHEIITDPQIGTRVEEQDFETIGLGSSGAIKLGLGDFIFYSLLVGRAAMYDFMTVYACYLAIIAGLGVTLVMLAFCEKALPALPVSVLLGVTFYLLTRVLLEEFVMGFSSNLLMF